MSRGYVTSILLIISIVLFLFDQLYAQEKEGEIVIISERISEEIQAHQDSVYQEPGTAFYLELGGKYIGSVNVDFPIKKSNRLSFGLMYICPCFMYFYLPGEKNSRFELGCGFTYNWLSDENPVILHGVPGYRYQKKKGLLFRAGFTPFIGIPFTSSGRFVIMPWVGISFGYSL